jgi:uncharacterized protein involved in type VI secretion and phage assembly
VDEVTERLVDWVRSRYFGKYRGTVVSNQDDTNRGRLQVHVPAVLGALEPWAMPCVPYAGDKVGFYSLPAKGAGVWVEFEAGDPSFPIWTGCFWADKELPVSQTDAAVKLWQTEKLILRADDDADELHLENDGGAQLTLGQDVVSASGNATHTVGDSGIVSENGKKIEVTSSAVKVNDGALEVT